MIRNILNNLHRAPFDFPVAAGGMVGDVICAPLKRVRIEPIVFDVGARNGMALSPMSYASPARLIGFEADVAEYDKQISGATDARKIGAFNPTFKWEEYHPYAASRARTAAILYHGGCSACTLIGEPDRAVTETMYLDCRNKLGERSYYDLHAKILRTERIQCITDAKLSPVADIALFTAADHARAGTTMFPTTSTQRETNALGR